jgi:hypothetical protein
MGPEIRRNDEKFRINLANNGEIWIDFNIISPNSFATVEWREIYLK